MSDAAAIVTGGGGGIGQAIVQELEEMGYAAWSLDLTAGPRERDLAVDVTDRITVSAAVTHVASKGRPVEVLVTVAGTFIELAVTDVTPAHWQDTLRLHLGGTVNACRAALPLMLDAGRGSIVAITSDLALSGAPSAAPYAAAKGAVIGFIRSLALELADTPVRANLVAPGPTDTPMIPPDAHYREEPYLSTVPARRLVRPDEISRAVRFLVEDGDFYVGQIISPNAGVVM